MKAKIKSILKKILFRNLKAASFIPVRIAENRIVEKVILKDSTSSIEITDKHCIVCHSPFFIAIWLTDAQLENLSSAPTLLVFCKERVSAKVQLTLSQKVSEGTNWILIYQINSAKCYQTNLVHQAILRKYFRNKNTILEDKIYGALYSYPRRVISVSYKEEGYYNIFPMDFQCFIEEHNVYLLGLRTTNVTIDKIIKSSKVVIADTNGATLEAIYFLGSHHSKSPTSVHKLPFIVFESEQFKFPIPDFAVSYKEVEIVKHLTLGTHALLIGRVVNAKELRKGNSNIYHIHFLESFRSNYPHA